MYCGKCASSMRSYFPTLPRWRRKKAPTGESLPCNESEAIKKGAFQRFHFWINNTLWPTLKGRFMFSARKYKADVASLEAKCHLEDILQCESELIALKDDQEVADAEWRDVLLAVIRERAAINNVQQQRLHAAQLEQELADVMVAKLAQEGEAATLTNVCMRQIDRGYPQMISTGVQTARLNPEEMQTSFKAYTMKVSALRVEIEESTSHIDTIYNQAEVDLSLHRKQMEKVLGEIKEMQFKINKLESTKLCHIKTA